MIRHRYNVRLALLALAILAGIALNHGNHHRLAEAAEPLFQERAT